MRASEELNMSVITPEATCIARINGVALHGTDEVLSADELRQRGCSELLRQAAVAQGLLPADDQPGADGVLSEAASAAIEVLLEKNLLIPEPSDEACQRHYAAHQSSFATGERVHVRHILFAVTQGLEVSLLRQRAEACLLNVRCHDGKATQDTFAVDAKAFSNCPSGADGGDLGWLTSADCAPEFAKELFGNKEVGVLPRLVHSRFGLHVVEVCERQAGQAQTFESVRGAVAMTLRQKTYVTALRQYLAVLSGAADIQGVDLDAAESPLVQ
jgi:peptidyl-prolyl cis-trans isomerase C